MKSTNGVVWVNEGNGDRSTGPHFLPRQTLIEHVRTISNDTQNLVIYKHFSIITISVMFTLGKRLLKVQIPKLWTSLGP